MGVLWSVSAIQRVGVVQCLNLAVGLVFDYTLAYRVPYKFYLRCHIKIITLVKVAVLGGWKSCFFASN